METTNFIYWFIGVLSMFIGIIMYPYIMQVKMHITQYFTRKKPTPPVFTNYLQSQIDELKEQIDNVAINSYRREANRKNNIRREVRSYLEELKTK